MRWGLVTDYEVYEDTQEARRFRRAPDSRRHRRQGRRHHVHACLVATFSLLNTVVTAIISSSAASPFSS
jgi:hypothetical protein